MHRFLFPVSLFLSAVLLFSIQPMVARALLPIYGGTPAVWTVCMLFFQAVLLFAYGYVWLLSSFNKPIVWRLVHTVVIVLSISGLPLLFRPLVMDGPPEWAILYNLLVQLGIPLLVIGASAPFLQFAYSQTKEKGAADPYFLYSASNLGSLLALILYPWVFERFIGLTYQFHLWSIGYAIYLVLLFFLLFTPHYKALEQKSQDLKDLSWKSMFIWVFLSFVPCSLMLGVTLYITTDVAATPLFWVLPLALYLLTFVVTFTSKPLIAHSWVVRNTLFFLIFPILGFILGVNQVSAWQIVLFNLLGFFILALLCHGELFQRRPKPQLLTLFYFCLALGGVLAGIFNGILAPHWFNQVYEYPLAILLSLIVLPMDKSIKNWWMPFLLLGFLLVQYYLPTIHWPKGFNTFQITGVIVLIVLVVWKQSKSSMFFSMLILFVFIFSPLFQQDNILLQERNFYGVKQVLEKNRVHALISQSTLHGLQPIDEKKPLSGFRSYYGALQRVVELMQHQYSSMSVTIMGLGAGTMVCQHRVTDHLKVIEIDKQVIDLAKDSRLFTYLRDCPAPVEIIKSDGRLAMTKLLDFSQNLLILDAFNSDSIPVHLMTLDAFSLYKKKLSENGVILVNLSNRHVQLLPVLNAIGRSLDLIVLYLAHNGDPHLGQFNSEWALLTSNQDFAFKLMNGTGWQFVADGKQFLWTDDYSNIIPLLKW